MRSLLPAIALVSLVLTGSTAIAQMGGGPGMGGGMGGPINGLGRMLFMDPNLSMPAGQSCMSCHAPEAGFTDPDKRYPTSKGAVAGRFGNRNTPSAAYASFSPPLQYDPALGAYVGGMFWDGRVNTLAEQAKGPFLNPLEMNMPSKAAVVSAVQNSMYSMMFTRVFGANAFANADQAYDNIALALQAFQQTAMVNSFSSKYDAWRAGTATLTAQETRGMNLMQGNCSSCHSMTPNAQAKVIFSNFSYHNMGVPANPDNPFYDLDPEFNPDGRNWIDRGLGGTLDDPNYDGFFKTPSLRNVLATGPYGHNGAFATLEEMVWFMLQQSGGEAGLLEAPSGGLPPPTFTQEQVDDILAFLGTLNDAGVVPEPATMGLLLAGGGLLLLRRRQSCENSGRSRKGHKERRLPVKSTWTIAMFLLASAQTLQASIVSESFIIGSDPSAGQYATAALSGQNPAVAGFTGGWSGSSGYAAASQGLMHPLATWADGGAASFTGSGSGSINRVLDTYASYGTGSGTYYYSSLMSFDDMFAATDGAMALTEFNNSSSTGYGIRWGFTTSSGTVKPILRLRTMGQGWSVKTYSIPVAVLPDAAYLFVIKVQHNGSGSNEIVNVWVNPTDLSSEAAAGAPSLQMTFAGLQDSSYPQNRMGLSVSGLGGSTSVSFDEVRFGATWAEAVPEPAVMSLLLAGLASLRRRN